MKTKIRLVSVRLSQDEYDGLKSLTAERAGSVSGLIRASIRGILKNGNRTLIEVLSGSGYDASGTDLVSQVSRIRVLERRLDHLDREIKRLAANNINA